MINILLPFLYNALLAATYPLSKIALTLGPLPLFIALRMLVGGIIFLNYYVITTHTMFKANASIIKKLALLGIGTMYIPFMIEAWALRQVSALQVNALYLLNPLVCATLEYRLAGKTLGMQRIVALFLGLAGSILFLSFSSSTSGRNPYPVESKEIAVLVALLTSICSATYSWLTVKQLVRTNVSISYVNGIMMMSAGIISLITFFIVHQLSTVASMSWTPFLMYSIIVGIIGNVASFGLLAFLIKNFNLTLIALAQGTMPLFGALYEYMWNGTFLSIQETCALILTMIGIGIFYNQETRNSQ